MALGWEGAIVVVVLAISLLIMGFDLAPPHWVFASMVGIFMAARIITVKEGSAGFSNTGVLTASKQSGSLETLFS
jgi:hypothetical protein